MDFLFLLLKNSKSSTDDRAGSAVTNLPGASARVRIRSSDLLQNSVSGMFP